MGHVLSRCRCCALPAAGANGCDMATIAVGGKCRPSSWILRLLEREFSGGYIASQRLNMSLKQLEIDMFRWLARRPKRIPCSRACRDRCKRHQPCHLWPGKGSRKSSSSSSICLHQLLMPQDDPKPDTYGIRSLKRKRNRSKHI